MADPTVAQMTVANAIIAVQSATAHDNDTQTTGTQITAELDREYRRVRRWLSTFVPSLYQKTQDYTIAAGSTTAALSKLTKPVDFERIIRLEQQFSQGYMQPLAVRPALMASEGTRRDTAGTYLLTYVARPVDGYTAFDVPDGVEDIIISIVAGWVRQRHNEDPSYHMARAEQMKREAQVSLVMRYGAHPVSAFQNQSGWAIGLGSFYEEGNYLVVM